MSVSKSSDNQLINTSQESKSIINMNYLRSGIIETKINGNDSINDNNGNNGINGNKTKSTSSSYKFSVDQQYSNAVKDIITNSNCGKVIKNHKSN